MPFDIKRVINNIVKNSGIPGQGTMALKSQHHGIAEVALVTVIRTRSVTEGNLVEIAELLELPIPNELGVFEVKGQNICLVRRARNANPDQPISHVRDLVIESIEDIYAEIIADGLNASMAPVRRGTGAFDRQLFETKLAAAFSSDQYARNLPPIYNEAAALAWQNTIVIDNAILDPKNPVPAGWERCLDITTTPQSDKVCTVYTLAKGATVENKRIKPGSSLFSEVSTSGLFAPVCAPTQMYKPWSTLRNHIKLCECETPLVNHTGADTGLFQGRNLITAIIHDEHNQMDQLTISESAAAKLVGFVFMAEVVQVTSGGSELKVQIGDTIQPKQVLAKVISAEGTAEVKARRLIRPAVVHNIESVPRSVNGVHGIQHRIILRSVAPLTSGDKLMPRHGCKGCVVVVPDEQMPELEINGKWVRAEITVNPYPVAKRKNLAMLLEIATTEAGIKEVPLDVNAGFLKDLFDKGYGHKKNARRNGKNLDFKVTAGSVFWMRSDSLRDYRTYGVSEVKKNFQKLNPDRGRNSGVSYGPIFRILLAHDKQCQALDKALVEGNFNPNINPLVRSLYEMLDPNLALTNE